MEKNKIVKERVLKRIFDLSVSALCLIVFSPLFLLIALLLKLEGLINASFKGPVFFKETRISKGKRFEIYKFRTVKSDILKLLHEDKERSITEFTSYRGKHKYLTPVGWILVQIYLDELPQFFNVIKGEMSLVGPRPHILNQYENDLRDGAVSAKYIKAGLMGPVQASKGNPALKKILALVDKRYIGDIEKVTSLEGIYLEKYLKDSSIKLFFYDVWIIFRCLVVVLKAQGM